MPFTIEDLSVTRIEELDSVTSELLKDPSNVLWAVLEVNGKVYKFSLREALTVIDGNDTRVPALLKRIEELERKMNLLLIEGIDENQVLQE